MFRLKPCQRLPLVGRAFRRYPGFSVDQRKRSVTVTVEQLVSAAGGVQVVIKYSVLRHGPVVVRVMQVGEFRGVSAEQVVKCEPAGNAFGYQMRPSQLGQHGTHLCFRYSGETGNGRRCNVGPEVDPQKPEQPSAGVAEPLVGPGKYGPHISSLVPAVERVQLAPGLAQFCGERGEAKPLVGSSTCRHDR